MSEIEATFLEAIRAAPDDDEVRRVYADWLDERGDPRGEYLRLEIQLVRGPARLAELAAALDPSWLYKVQRRYRLVLVSSAQKIATIKLIRELTGLGLKQAKDLVDQMPKIIADDLELDDARDRAQRFAGIAEIRLEPEMIPLPPPAAPLPEARFSVVLQSIVPGRRLQVIKRVREVVDLDPKTAKLFVDRVLAGAPS